MLWLPNFLPWSFTKVLEGNTINWLFSYNYFLKLSLYIKIHSLHDPFVDPKQHYKGTALYWKHVSDLRLFVSPFLGLMNVCQGSHRLEKYLNIQDCLEKSLKINLS